MLIGFFVPFDPRKNLHMHYNLNVSMLTILVPFVTQLPANEALLSVKLILSYVAKMLSQVKIYVKI